MSVSTQTTKVIYQGDGGNTVFPIPFPFAASAYVRAVKVNADGTESPLTADYFIDATARALTYPGYPPGQAPAVSEQPPVLSGGEKLVIYRDTDATQEISLPSETITRTIEGMADKNTMLIQELAEDVTRAVVLPVSSEGIAALPSPIVPGASLAVANDGSGFRYAANPDLMEYAVATANAANVKSTQAIAAANGAMNLAEEIADTYVIKVAENSVITHDDDGFTLVSTEVN